MKLTKSKLKQIIKEEIDQMTEAGVAPGHPWPPDADPAGEELPPEFQYEYVLDELVNAARDGVMPLAVKKLKDAGHLSSEEGGGRGLTYNDIELEIEEGLLDALTPLAKIIHAKTNNPRSRYPWEHPRVTDPRITEVKVKVGDKVKHKELGEGRVTFLHDEKPGERGGARRASVKWDTSHKGKPAHTIVDSLTVIKKGKKK